MKLVDYITIDNILFLPPDLDKYDVIRFIVNSAPCFESIDSETLVNGFLRREEHCTTAIGRGIAIPHTKLEIPRILACFCQSMDGVEFDSVDGQPTQLFFPFVSNVWNSQDHGRYMVSVSWVVNDETHSRRLRRACTREEILEIFTEAR